MLAGTGGVPLLSKGFSDWMSMICGRAGGGGIGRGVGGAGCGVGGVVGGVVGRGVVIGGRVVGVVNGVVSVVGVVVGVVGVVGVVSVVGVVVSIFFAVGAAVSASSSSLKASSLVFIVLSGGKTMKGSSSTTGSLLEICFLYKFGSYQGCRPRKCPQ